MIDITVSIDRTYDNLKHKCAYEERSFQNGDMAYNLCEIDTDKDNALLQCKRK